MTKATQKCHAVIRHKRGIVTDVISIVGTSVTNFIMSKFLPSVNDNRARLIQNFYDEFKIDDLHRQSANHYLAICSETSPFHNQKTIEQLMFFQGLSNLSHSIVPSYDRDDRVWHQPSLRQPMPPLRKKYQRRPVARRNPQFYSFAERTSVVALCIMCSVMNTTCRVPIFNRHCRIWPWLYEFFSLF